MFSLVARLVGGIFTPLIDKAFAASARVFRRLAFFVVAALAMLVVLIALTMAFDLWIASMAGAIVGALAVAGLYLVVAMLALWLAMRPAGKAEKATTASKPQDKKPRDKKQQDKRRDAKGRDSQIDDFAAPLLGILQGLGLRREQFAVLAGASVAKQLGPVPLVGLAIVAGFLIGRMWDGWRALLSTDALATIFTSGVFGQGARKGSDEDSEGRPG